MKQPWQLANDDKPLLVVQSYTLKKKITRKLNKLRKRKLFERQTYQNNDHYVLRLCNASYARLTLTLAKRILLTTSILLN